MYTIYAIHNRTVNKYYVGQTKNLDGRLKLHNSKGFRGYTARFPGKWELIYKESVATRQEALRREKQLKSYQGRLFVKSHIPE